MDKTEASPPRFPRLTKAINILVLFCGLWTGFVLTMMAMDRQTFVGISQAIYGTGKPVMDSGLADSVTHGWFSVLIGVLTLSLLAKEFFIRSPKKRLFINTASLAVLLGFSILMMHLLFGAPLSGFIR